MRTKPCLAWPLAAAALQLAACSAEVTGPTPAVSGLDPSLVCGEQLTTEVSVSGAELSPLAIDAATGDPLLAIPDLTLQRVEDLDGAAVSDAPVVLPNDPTAPDAARVRWTSPTSMAFDVYPELGLAPGLYRITATNRNGRSATLEAAIAIVPRPEIDDDGVQPDLICVQQGMRQITLTGSGFLQIGDELPTVAFGDVVLPVDSIDGTCIDPLPGPTTAKSCDTAHVTVPEDALEPGAIPVVITNPTPAACSSENDVTLAVVPRPEIETVVPDLFCSAQGDRMLTVSGTGFVAIRDAGGDALPTVTIGSETLTAASASDCVSIDGTLLDAESCDTLTVVVPQSFPLLGEQAVTVTNPAPADCFSEETVTVAIVPPPVLVSVEPDLICNAEGVRTLVLTGTDFVTIDDVLPDVTIGVDVFTATAADGCADIDGTLLTAQSCTELTVEVPQSAVGTGAFEVSVTNPNPAGCTSEETVTLAIVPEPTLVSAAPDLFCTEDGGTSITLTGTGFVVAGAELPIVHFGDTPITAADAADCTAIAGTTISPAESCTTLTVDIPAGAVPLGVHAVVVENPAPAGCDSNESVTVEVVGRPAITAIEPPAVCESAQPSEMIITGVGFLRVGEGMAIVDPTVLVDGSAVAITTFDGCSDLTGTSLAGQVCTELRFPVPVGGFALGTHTVSITNPAPADCAMATDATFDVTAAPAITSVEPTKVCADGDSFLVNGDGFVSGSEIVLDGMTVVPSTTLSATQVQGDIAAGFTADVYDVQVRNGPGCESNTLADALIVVNAPVVFFVDPPVVYNGIDLQVTIFASGITDDVATVGIRPAGTMDALTILSHTYDPGRPNRVLATVPKDTPAGDYDVVIEDTTCGAFLENSLHITGDLTVDVASIDPVFGRDDDRTGVTIRSTVPAPAGKVNFAPTPRAYLNPLSGGLATEIKSVSFVDVDKMTGIVPAGLTPDVYQLIVINPDGSVGLLDDAFEVVAEPPPIITSLLPGLVANQPDQVVMISGAEFRTPVAVEATCKDPLGATTVVPAVVGPTTTVSIETTWDMTGREGSVCVVRVTNTDNGTYSDFSAISVTNPSGNLNPFVSDETMVLARRALAAGAVRMNANSRYLFAIGGDAGLGTDPHSSVEAAPVDPFGDVEPWVLQRNSLPEGRTYIGGAVVNRHIYVAGGRVGTGAGTVDAEVLRAYLLDPDEAPEVTDLNLATGGGAGLDGGIWYYRIAAVMGATDANNPNGEGLPSEPLVVQLPALDDKVHLSLYWAAVPGATSYRIYRTPTAGLIAGDERLLVEVAHGGAPTDLQSFVDDGTIDNSGATEVPMPLGSLGVWHSVGTLDTPREGAAIVAVPDPVALGTHYLYVLGGRDASSAPLSSYEWATVNAPTSDMQTVTSLQTEASGLFIDEGRWQLGALYVDSTRATVLAGTPDDVWIYATTGMDGSGGMVNAITALQVDTANGVGADDGRLGAPIDVNAPGGTSGGGRGWVVGNNIMFVFGAQSGAPSTAAKSASICDGVSACPGGQDAPPGLKNWNAGIALSVARYLHGVAVESAFIFVLGGQTDTEAASASTERTNM